MENKTGRYFKYAIGEIILVVIGILIALQINNWNEYRKQVKEENEIIQSFKAELKTKSNQLKISIERNKEYVEHSRDLLSFIKNDTVSVLTESDVANFISYYPYQTDMPVLNEILKSDNKLVSKKDIIGDLRQLSTSARKVEKNLFYIDEIYNSKVTDFIISIGFELSYKIGVGENRNISLEYIKQNGYNSKQLIALFNTVNILRADFTKSQKEMLNLIEDLNSKLKND
ncbi:DUF6090 family protein [Winogradskyella flava]|uniref:DUF6090 family protein n=1 Tax=Winogradskyella flava TaxID=1884876 RepID=UPI00249356AD|nr:DUF6090 family protein [Winogradskyella flava]